MSHACHRFWKCYKTLTFCSLLRRCTIPCACHAKRHLNVQKWSGPGVCCAFWLRNVLRATTACTFTTSQLLKCSEAEVFCTFWLRHVLRAQRRPLFWHLNFQKWSGPGVCCAFWLRNVLRATTACAFSTSQLLKSALKLRCFVHFDFEMCFAPQRRPLFRHLNFQKCSEREVFLPFSLANVLRATTACTFSSLIWPAWLRTGRLASLLFDLPEPQIIKKI